MILFMDIDGVLLPTRAYCLPTQTKPFVKKFDPCAVALVNRLCDKTGAKIVIHSSWLRTALNMVADVRGHMVKQGIKAKHFHKDHSCKYRFSGSRWLAISDWLDDHQEVDNYWIFDDEPMPDQCSLNKDRMIQTEFDDGIQLKHIERIMNANAFLLGELKS